MNANVNSKANASAHLSTPELELLLSDELEFANSHAAAGHLESCSECQSRLSALAADDHWWSDVHTMLSDELEPRWAPDLSSIEVGAVELLHDADSIERSVRELLETPQHPEMFGRLGRYDIERVIGHGGMGVVLKAHDSELNRPIAIKLLAGHLAHVGAARERFAREGRAAAAVVHEHVVGIYNVETNGRVPYLVMQYVPGRSLQARVDEDGPLGTEEILRIGMQAASGLAAAHRQGLVHRDVKPSNILLEDTVERAVLTDFGLARTFDDASLTHTGILAGTPHYMSPEQATGEPIDQRSDLFSLGAVLYFMASGHPPFRAASAMAVLHRICRDAHRPVWERNREIPDALSDVIDRLLEKKPGKRFGSADEVQQLLATLLSRLQQHGLGRRRFRHWRNQRARRTAALVCTIAVVATFIAGITTYVRSTGSAQQGAKATADEAGLMKGEGDFLSGLQDVNGGLGAASGDWHYLHQGEDPWQRALETLHRDVAELESQSF